MLSPPPDLTVLTADEAASLISNGMTVAMSGWAMAGYPKAVPEALARRRESGEELGIGLITGANVPWLDEKLSDLLIRRAPMIAHRAAASRANAGSIAYVEQQMDKMPKLLRRGAFGPVGVAVVEALGFDEAGNLIPTSSAGLVHLLLDAAESIIVEVNKAQPAILADLHDIHIPAAPPDTRPIPLVRTADRIGAAAVPVDLKKIRGIVETDIPERMSSRPKGNEITAKIAGNLFTFLESEYGPGGALPPIQLGFGSLADSIADALGASDYTDLQFFCGGVTEPVMELLASGKAAAVSAGGLGMSERVGEILDSVPDIAERLVLRNGEITNSAEVVGRLGLMTLNTGIEVDIYGNVNSSHIAGSRVVNGIGGGAGFARNAGLSVVLIPSMAKGGAISGIVPMVSHQDIGEHDVDVVITENGVADLRGLDDIHRAAEIISECASDAYVDQLVSYLNKAGKDVGGHHPQLPVDAADWHRRLKEEGTMLEKRS